MQTEHVLFKEFDQHAVPGKAKTNRILPGGRTKGEVPPPPPTFSEEELKAAQAEAYKKGFAEGTEEGKRQQKDAEADTQQALRQTLHNICASFTPLAEDYKHTVSHLRTHMPQVALAAAKKAAGKAMDENATEFLNDMVERCLKTIPDKPDITITIHDSMAAALTAHLKTFAQTYPVAAQVNVVGNGDMNTADCKLAWKDGALLRDTTQIWEQIDQAIEQLSAGESFTVAKEMKELPSAAPPAEGPAQTEEILEEPKAALEEAGEAQHNTPDAVDNAPADDQPPAKE